MRFPALGLAILVGCTDLPSDDPEPTPAPPATGWHVEAGRIVGPDGREFILHGINLSNDVKHPPYASWAGPEDYARLQSWGYSVLRLLTGWAAVMPEEGRIDEDYLERYGERITVAEEHGLLVIIDMHSDVFGEGFGGNGAPRWACDEALYASFEPQDPWYAGYFEEEVQACYDRFWTDLALQDRYIEAFVAVAERFAGRPNVVGFDLFNEPSWGSSELDVFHAQLLQPFYERLIEALVEVIPDRRLFFVEPATPVQYGLDPTFERFANPDVVYAPHYYHYGVHDLHEFDGATAGIEYAMDSFEATAARLRTPWFLGELGGYTDSTNFDVYMRALMGFLDERGVGDAYWSYDPGTGGFGPLNDDRSEKPELLDVHARTAPKAVAGRIESYGFDDTTGAFHLTWTPRPGLDETLLAFPAARQYPGGWDLSCTAPEGSWSFEAFPERAEAVLRLEAGTEGPVTLEITRR